jgi:hypothetical protein
VRGQSPRAHETTHCSIFKLDDIRALHNFGVPQLLFASFGGSEDSGRAGEQRQESAASNHGEDGLGSELQYQGRVGKMEDTRGRLDTERLLESATA